MGQRLLGISVRPLLPVSLLGNKIPNHHNALLLKPENSQVH